jgi:hypothetical protein
MRERTGRDVQRSLTPLDFATCFTSVTSDPRFPVSEAKPRIRFVRGLRMASLGGHRESERGAGEGYLAAAMRAMRTSRFSQ